MKTLLNILLYSCLIHVTSAQNNELDFSHHFQGTKCCFVLYDIKDNTYTRFNEEQCEKAYSPCSTFKIPNSLIALESGVADNDECYLKWDSIQNPREPWMNKQSPFKYWSQDHTMRTAIKNSVVWYYQEIARRIGKERMQIKLNQLQYGNRDISSGIDNFWLCASLQISANEQVEFLTRFYLENLIGFKAENIQQVKEIIRFECTDGYTLYGKTGGGDCFENKVIGWYVGFVETPDKVYIFAMNMIADDFSAFSNNRRIEQTKAILEDLEVIN